jgi:hypothetical protein
VMTFVAAVVSHAASGDPVGKILGPVFALVLVLTSYWLRGRVKASVAAAQVGDLAS